jgi:hypothetical protein
MPDQISIGLFRTEGYAEDARNRLVYEGIPAGDIELRKLAREADIPAGETPETIISFVDWLFGNELPERYGIHVTNGETAICVRASDPAVLDAAETTLRQFSPLLIERVSPPQEEAVLQAAARSGKPPTR